MRTTAPLESPTRVAPPRRHVRRAWSTAALTLALSVLLVLPAAAHPFIRGGEAPVDSLASLQLDLAHGCASETAGEGDPTTEVALEVPEWMWIAAVPEPDGWEVSFETDPEGFATVVVWDARDATEPAPVFDLDVVVEGEAGEERFLSVFQACDDFSYRWIGTPDEPADDPAIRLRLVAADPDAPAPERTPIAPPEEEAPEEDTDGDAADEGSVDVDDPADETATTDPDEAEDATEEESTDEAATDADAVDEADGTLAAEATDGAGGALVWILAGIGLLVLGGAAVWYARRSTPTEA
ncbi:MAG: hypothetical protein JJT89_02415 [Nitriliruptoraceae bacterium]|nr:hypothetical protein [Nitriliruptoraceae bacterium]